jgi:nucleoside-diphosphate-sugar epimerase
LPHQFVFIPDVGPLVLRLLDTPAAFGKVWHFGGSGVMSQADIVGEIERQTGRPLKLRVAGKAMLWLLGRFKPMLRELVEMYYLVSEPVIMDDSALERLLGPIPRTSYREGVRQTLAASRARAGSAQKISAPSANMISVASTSRP